MKKEELKNKVSNFLLKPSSMSAMYDEGYARATRKILSLIEQLEEPLLPIIPQFVADWIDKNKNKYNIKTALGNIDAQEDDICDWVLYNLNTFARAWLDGYTIEKEPQWVVNTGENEYFVDFFDRLEPHIVYGKISDGDEIMRFDLKQRAEAVATLIGGTVEEVT